MACEYGSTLQHCWHQALVAFCASEAMVRIEPIHFDGHGGGHVGYQLAGDDDQ